MYPIYVSFMAPCCSYVIYMGEESILSGRGKCTPHPPPPFPCTSQPRLFKGMGSSNEYHVVKIILIYNKHISSVTLKGNELLSRSNSLNS